MFKNYLKIAIRNLWKEKGFSAINVFGLALGIGTCLLIMVFVLNELSYDRYNKNADRIVRVVLRGKMQGGEIKEAHVMPPVAKALKENYPEIEEATRIHPFGLPRISDGTKTFREDAFAFVDSNFFKVFTIPLIQGDEKTALAQPNTVVISKAVAQKYFGAGNPVGKTLRFVDRNISLTITGMFDKVPVNSHFHFGFFAALSSLPEASDQDWLTSNYYTYLLLPKGYNSKKLEAKLPEMVEKYISPQLQKSMGITMDQYRKSGNNLDFFLQPLTDIHLRSDFTGDMEPYGDIQYVYIFAAVAIFMLLIACINFMNLSTAGASRRAKEVGIRKVMGSQKSQLVFQFLMESFLLVAFAILLALGLVYFALPFFNTLAGKSLTLGLTTNPWILPALVLLGLLTGALAGGYPAFFLSSFKPIAVLKGKFVTSKRNSVLRSGLVVFQFFISICLIIGTAIVYMQLTFIRHKKLGYDKEQVVILQDTYWLGKGQDYFRQELLQDPRIVSISCSDYLPAGPSNKNNYFAYPDHQSSQIIKTLKYDVDNAYIPTLGMKMAAGRNFSKDYSSDSSGVILNETAARIFGWGEKALDHTITHVDNDGKSTTYHVIGIVKDFHFKSLHELITPLIMLLGTNYGNMIVKVRTADASGLLASMKTKWTTLNPETPLSYSFLDDRFNNTYKEEQNIDVILGLFAGLTIFVACLGLLGLAMFTAQIRKKEIGIRKVLGANVTGIISLLSKEFLKLVIIAFLIASPISWIIMNGWLKDFA
jgi:putative ABC transport system permease protein